MNTIEFENAFDAGILDDEYMEYILNNSNDETVICNGDTLLNAFENQYLYNEFKMYKVNE